MKPTREMLLTGARLPGQVRTMDLPGIGEVCVRSLSGRARASFIAMSADINAGKPPANFYGWMAAQVLCDQNGKRLYTDDDAEALGELDGGALDALLLATLELSGLNAEALESARKNSPATGSGAPGSGSPVPLDVP